MSPIHRLLRPLILAAMSGIYLVSTRRDFAISQIRQMCVAESKHAPEAPWRLLVWDIKNGLRIDGIRDEDMSQMLGAAGMTRDDLSDPTACLNALPALAARDHRGEIIGSTLLVLKNCEEDFERRGFREALEQALFAGKQSRCFVVPLNATDCLPIQLRNKFRVVNHPHPKRKEIEKTIRNVAEAYGVVPDDVTPLVGACGGMDEDQIETAIAEIIVDLPEGEHITPRHIMTSKKEALAAQGLTLHEGAQTYKDVVGLDNAKAVYRALLRDDFPTTTKRLGILCLGIPGTGKSYLAGAAANEMGWQLVAWNPNNLKGSLQGETEANWRLLKSAIEAQASEGGRLILLIDEIEKLLAGAMDTSSSKSDGGVMAGIGGDFLSWLQDRKPGTQIFVVGTCNNMETLQKASAGAFARAGRFNATLFWDYPTPEQRKAAWTLYRRIYQIPSDVAPMKGDDNLTPAEVQGVCEAFVIYQCQSLDHAASFVSFVKETSADHIEALQKNASGRYVSADYQGKYRFGGIHRSQESSEPSQPRPTIRRPGKAKGEGEGGLFSN